MAEVVLPPLARWKDAGGHQKWRDESGIPGWRDEESRFCYRFGFRLADRRIDLGPKHALLVGGVGLNRGSLAHEPFVELGRLPPAATLQCHAAIDLVTQGVFRDG